MGAVILSNVLPNSLVYALFYQLLDAALEGIMRLKALQDAALQLLPLLQLDSRASCCSCCNCCLWKVGKKTVGVQHPSPSR